VDFKLDSVADNGLHFVLLVGSRGQLEFFDYLAETELEVVKAEYTKSHSKEHSPAKTEDTANALDWPSLLRSLIVECSYDQSILTTVFIRDDEESNESDGKWIERPGGWKFHRFRTDKNTPNDVSVVHKILGSIDDNVTRSDLEALFKEMKSNWAKREHQRSGTRGAVHRGGTKRELEE
jgi:hypothetical protein